MSANFSQKIELINTQLRNFGREAVQEIKMIRDGQVIGQIRYGYKAQYVFDAVNSVLQPENWRYEIVSKEIFEQQAVAEVKLFIRIDSEWLCKGPHTGQMNIVKQNVGDAYKGAVTDAIQKCFSLLSIGQDAYRGLLKEVYLGSNGNRPPMNQPKPHQPSTRRSNQLSNQGENQDPQPQQPPSHHQPSTPNMSDNLPQIAGIKYQHANGRIVAVGNSYEKKELLKSAGFRWNGAEKNWYKEVAVH